MSRAHFEGMRNVVFACVIALCACKRGREPTVDVGKPTLSAHDPATTQVEGIVERSTASELVFESAQPPAVAVDPQTTVVVDGQKATAIDIPAGSPVRAAFRLGDDGRPHATTIEARTRRGVGVNAPVQRGQPNLE